MRILLVEFTSAISGGERSMLELVRGLTTEHDVALACPLGPLADRGRELGVTVLPIPATQLTLQACTRGTRWRGLAAMARRRATPPRPSCGLIAPTSCMRTRSGRACWRSRPRGGSGPWSCIAATRCPAGSRAGSYGVSCSPAPRDVVAISEHVAASFGGSDWSEPADHRRRQRGRPRALRSERPSAPPQARRCGSSDGSGAQRHRSDHTLEGPGPRDPRP